MIVSCTVIEPGIYKLHFAKGLEDETFVTYEETDGTGTEDQDHGSQHVSSCP